MTAPLPESVTIFGIECHGERGIYSATDDDRSMSVEIFVSRTLIGKKYAAIVRGQGYVGDGSDWTVEGPYRETPQSAVDALHALVRRLAGEIG